MMARVGKTMMAAALAVLCAGTLLLSGTAKAADVTLSRAKQIAAQHAGYTVQQVSIKKAKLDRDDGEAQYEVDFTKNGYKYEYEIDAATGEVREHSRKLLSKARNSGKSVIGVEKAKEAALSHAGLKAADVTFTKEKLDEGRTSEYEIEFYTDAMRYEYDIDAASGAVNEYDHKATAAKAGGAPGSGAANDGMIGVEKAKQIALDHAGLTASQVKFRQAKLDRDEGVYNYDIEFTQGRVEYEYEIDALTGRIIEADIDYD